MEIETVLKEEKLNNVQKTNRVFQTENNDKPFELDALDQEIERELKQMYDEDQAELNEAMKS